MFVELFRLAVVLLGTGAALELSRQLELDQTAQLVAAALGTGGGYVVGGLLGRFTQGRISAAEQSLQQVAASEIVAGIAGMLLGLVVAASVTWPVLLFGGKAITVPLAAVVVLSTTWAGLRLGRSRAGELMRFLRAGGRLPSNARAVGAEYKLIDTSALIDGRLVEVCQDGWMEGVLLVPEFVLYELQGLADSGDPERRRRGQRGLDSLAALQRLSGVGVDVLAEDPGGDDVDIKLLKIARQRGTPLVTTDANLARVAEVQGVAVRNLHTLANSLRPPVQPGEVLEVNVSKAGREQGQGVGYLPDGTMVVIEDAASRVGSMVEVEVTSVMSNSRGRMVFGTRQPPPDTEPSRPRLLRGDGG